MRTFGRACRGARKVFLKVVRQTERELLEVGRDVGPLCLSAMLHLSEADRLTQTKREYLHEKLRCAAANYEPIQAQSRRLVNGKKLPHAKIVNAYDTSTTAIVKGKSNCPAQFGKKPGIIAEMATGLIYGLHLPQGNPDDASYMMPLLDIGLCTNYSLELRSRSNRKSRYLVFMRPVELVWAFPHPF